MPKISIVTPTYNRAVPLKRAIKSVQNQNYQNYEHIIVDDGSSDTTQDMIAELDDENIIYVRLPQNKGANIARNRGIELANSPVITFLDSDDEFKPNRLSITLNIFDQSPNVAITISSFVTKINDEFRDSANPNLDLTSNQLEKALITHAICIAGSAISARTDLVRAINGFSPHLKRLQDRDFLLKLSTKSGARTLSNVDWIKHVSPDAISAPLKGYVNSFADLLNLHPHFTQKYPDLIKYHAARNIIRAMLKGKFLTALNEYKCNQKRTQLGFNFQELVSGYKKGKSSRKKYASELMRGR